MGSRLIQPDADNMVASSIYERLKTVPELGPESYIYRAPITLRQVKETAYTPQLLSIGPFHCGELRLQSMQLHKMRYVKDFLGRRPDLTLNSYIGLLRGLEGKARQCYGEPISFTSDEFMEMLIVDGLFMVEFIRKWVDEESRRYDQVWLKVVILWDLILVENQLPFFVLESIFNFSNAGNEVTDDLSFLGLSIKFLEMFVRHYSTVDIGLVELEIKSGKEVKHFVHLLHQCFTPLSPRVLPKRQRREKSIPSATELHASGVKFTRIESKSMFDITFTKNGWFNIPQLIVDDNTELIFRNVIAFEHLDNSTKNLTDYCKVMDCLIDTPADVSLLRHREIIVNCLGEDGDVSRLFNNILKGAFYNKFDTFYYALLVEDVNAYYHLPRHKFLAILKREYFNTPWSTISFIAALVMVVCTVIQAVACFK